MFIIMENGYSKFYMFKDMLLFLNLYLSKIILKKVIGIYGFIENIKYLIMVYWFIEINKIIIKNKFYWLFVSDFLKDR